MLSDLLTQFNALFNNTAAANHEVENPVNDLSIWCFSAGLVAFTIFFHECCAKTTNKRRHIAPEKAPAIANQTKKRI
jgi:hypothetical protein